MKYQSPTEYVRNKAIRKNTLHVIKNGKMFAVLREVEIHVDEFNALFPLGDKIRVKHDSQKKGEGIGSAGI